MSKNILTVFGEYDMMLYVKTNDYHSLGQKVIEEIRIIPGVEDTLTLAGCTIKDLPYKG